MRPLDIYLCYLLIMQIFIVFRTYSDHDRYLFTKLVNRLFKLGVSINAAEVELRRGKEKYALLDIPTQDKEKVTFKQMSFFMMSNLFAGYVSRMNHPMKHHINLRSFMYYFDDLVIDQNQELLNKLYAREEDICNLIIH